MSRDPDRPARKPLIALVDRANRALQADMVQLGTAQGLRGGAHAHNAVFGHLPSHQGAVRWTWLTCRDDPSVDGRGGPRPGRPRLVEMVPDPADGRRQAGPLHRRGRRRPAPGYRHIRELEQRFVDELGDDYEAARRVLERVVEILEPTHASCAPDVADMRRVGAQRDDLRRLGSGSVAVDQWP